MTIPPVEPAPLTLDLGAVAATLRRRLPVVIGGVAVGGLVAAGILAFVTPRFDGHAMMLIRTSSSSFDPSSMVKDRLGPVSELLPSSMGLGGSDEELSTELALLQSRAVLGAVVDSLHLEVIPREPTRAPPAALVDSVAFTSRFKPYKTALVPGPNHLADAAGTVWAKRTAQVKLMDREDAIDDLADRLTVRKTGGDAIALDYRARDSVTAAAVPNLVAAIYMVRRKTVDRGLNQRRLEFLNAKADSVRGDLRKSTDQLADVAEASGAGASADIAGRALADEIGALEARLSEITAGESALDSLVSAVQIRHADPQTLAGFPDLLRSPALNDLISQIATVETNRTVLLATRPESAPQVIALQRARDSLVAELLPIATAYRQSLARQRASVEHDLGVVQARLNRLPGQAAAVGKEQAEVTRLAALNAGMGAEVLQARLAALAEGGDVRVIDEAVEPRRETFPRPVPTVVVCLVAGLVAGMLLAVVGGPVVRRG